MVFVTDKNLQFPINCHYRIIAEKREGMHFVIETVLMEQGVTAPLLTENISQGGKYQSFHVDVIVHSKEEMNAIDAALRSILGVRMVF